VVYDVYHNASSGQRDTIVKFNIGCYTCFTETNSTLTTLLPKNRLPNLMYPSLVPNYIDINT